MSILETRGLVIGYRDPLCEPIDMSLRAGESVAISGNSGIGKTTFLNTILGVTKPLRGKVFVQETDVHSLSYSKLAGLRATTIGTIFQRAELLSSYSALQNVMLPRLLANREDETVESEAEHLIASLGVEPSRRAEDLSGGERQRIALARALIIHPSLILADEPTGSLDPATRDEVIDLLFSYLPVTTTALLIVTHDPVVAEQADRIQSLQPVPQQFR